jgi:hypothetical protein
MGSSCQDVKLVLQLAMNARKVNAETARTPNPFTDTEGQGDGTFPH